MLEWLKTILGDNYSEDIDKKVSEEIGKGFVAKADFTAAKGKNAKAIRALLDVDALKVSKNQTEDAKKALDVLREESGYLFESAEAPPPFAAGAGTGKVMTDPQSVGGEITKQLFGH